VQIPEHKIEEVRERVDLVALVSRHVDLKKSGRSFTGRCPVHQEKTPSFFVSPERGTFKCFGCQEGGDAITFVQRYFGKTFVDAVQDLAREVGVDLEAAEDPGAREKQQLKEVTDLAFEHFRTRLWEREVGRYARQYLEGRGVTEDVARAFGLGWAPNTWQDLVDLFTRHGVLEWAFKAGLVQQRSTGNGYFDVFRGRLMIPIRAPEGRPIAFGGRSLIAVEGQEGPKYLNSKESRLYNKSDTLYGMDRAREEIRKRKAAVLVEGYFDCIGMHQAGVRHAVALCSTALTPGHLSLLSRNDAKEIILLLDGDQAGRKAVERLAGPLLAQGVTARVALLPDGEDPDTFARKTGAEAVHALLGKAQPLTEHLFHTLLPHGRGASFEEKMQAVDRLKPLCAQVPPGLTRSAFFAALSDWSGLPALELESTLKSKVPLPKPSLNAPPRPNPFMPGPATSPTDRATPPSPTQAPHRTDRPPDPLEALFVASLLCDPSLLSKDSARVAGELSHPGFRHLVGLLASGQTTTDALYEASDAVKRALDTAKTQLPDSPGDNLEQAFTLLSRKLKLKRIDEQLTHIQRVTALSSSTGELTEEIRKLMGERSELLALRKKVLAEGLAVTTGTKKTSPAV